jgi:biopolymer transport protein ExbD
MAGGGSPTPSKGGKKNVDFTVNLVPTIDLLSVLIAFLLITAVWTQLARINAQQVLPKTSDKPQEQTDEKKDKKLLILIETEEISVGFTEEAPTVLRKSDGDYVKQLREKIKAIAEKIEDKPKQQIMVGANDAVEYKTVIQAMDILLDFGLTGMSVGDGNVVRGLLPNDPNAPPPGGAPTSAP